MCREAKSWRSSASSYRKSGHTKRTRAGMTARLMLSPRRLKSSAGSNPSSLTRDGVIIAGHIRYKAAKKLKCKEVPVVYADNLTEEQVKAYRLADNKTSELAEWDADLLSEELLDLQDFDMGQFGFDLNEMFSSVNHETKERGKEARLNESISVVIECENDEEAEKVFMELQAEGYVCRISTL